MAESAAAALTRDQTCGRDPEPLPKPFVAPFGVTTTSSRDAVRAIRAPLLVLLGNDVHHPSETSREIAALAPKAELVERWKEPEVVPETIQRVRAFLKAHTPR